MSDLTREFSHAKTYISASEQWQWSYELARRIAVSGWKPDVIIGLYRGGVFPAIVIEDYLRSIGIKTVHFPLVCRSYNEDLADSKPEEVQIYGFSDYIEESTVKTWNNILLVDDICDTGKTLDAVKKKILSIRSTSFNGFTSFNIRTACLIWKTDVKNQVTYPTWWMKEEKADSWIVFPHEFCGIDINEKIKKERNSSNDRI